MTWTSKDADIAKLHNCIQGYNSTLNTLMLQFHIDAIDVEDKKRDEHYAKEEAFRQRAQDWALQASHNATTQNKTINNACSMVRVVFTTVCRDVKWTLGNVAEATQHTLGNNGWLNPKFSNFQEPVRVEDAFGRSFPLGSELSVSDLFAIVYNRFKEGPGSGHIASATIIVQWQIVAPKESSS
ncbi:uncharacterized protein VDAG_10160 [Verticillium dahliae VdLs.17]|uniref:Uncharacterized protein n=1 Tax=Verticillium dahliae (strain VdLs.17 / ATCC MYA-4575 / FGSC 10137) TaxID=498257 RepID=G2XJ28_VERDV|nr:uncharacterized protein VDAG_10160 [Verticillium dahliae VdLs.17]EGY20531.1 hypothetical protein VDAG_10160 [Verticillium dahliae VdLs.17]KAH6696286.1 hypothetical protein EV126DRAFT_344569 [Verticillium dahliae]